MQAIILTTKMQDFQQMFRSAQISLNTSLSIRVKKKLNKKKHFTLSPFIFILIECSFLESEFNSLKESLILLKKFKAFSTFIGMLIDLVSTLKSIYENKFFEKSNMIII